MLLFLSGCSPAVSEERTPRITPAIETIAPTPTTAEPKPTGTPAPTPTTQATSTPTVTPVPTPVVLETLPAGLLPQSLYLLADDPNGITQVWRIDTQGRRTQVTYETEDITGMDVTTRDEAVAYTLADQLYLTHPGGSVPGLVIDGMAVSSPVFSQDGRKLAYAMDGVKIFDRLTGEWTNAIFNSGEGTKFVRNYTPVGWSPDGQRIMVRVQLFECNLFEFITLDGLETDSFGFGGVGTHTWGSDGRYLYFAEPVLGGMCGNTPGLWRIDSRTGKALPLVPSEMNGRAQLVGYPFEAPGGRLQYFLGQALNQGDAWEAPMRMVSTGMDGLSDRQGLHPDEYVFYDNYSFGEVLWAPDASFAIVTTVTDQPPRKDAWLLKADGSPAVFLGYLGYNLRWGKP